MTDSGELRVRVSRRPWGLIPLVSAPTGLGVPGYVRTDARLGGRPARAVEISLAGQNLLDGRHLESAAADYIQPIDPGRAVQLKAT
jgi:outer membrane receptor for monomeric catechols